MLFGYILQQSFVGKMASRQLEVRTHCKEEVETEHEQGYHSEEDEPLYHPSFWNQIFPMFVFRKMLTQSESSLIWLGTRLDSEDLIALKITAQAEAESSRSIHQQEEKLFLEKVKIKNMVDVLQIHDSEDYRLIVMRYYPWNLEDLARKISSTPGNRYGKEHMQFIRWAFKRILEAVSELHRQCFVHRDLKLDNFMVDEAFNIYLNDFELVTKQGEIDLSLAGTIDYMPPERLRLRRRETIPIQPAIDVWSLGVILYQLCTGTLPYRGFTPQEVEQEIYSRHVKDKDIPGDLMNLIQGMLEIRIDRRMSTQDICSNPFFQQQVQPVHLKKLMSE